MMTDRKAPLAEQPQRWNRQSRFQRMKLPEDDMRVRRLLTYLDAIPTAHL